jgi:hypothetical protein
MGSLTSEGHEAEDEAKDDLRACKRYARAPWQRTSAEELRLRFAELYCRIFIEHAGVSAFECRELHY